MFLTREILSLTGMAITEKGKPCRGARYDIWMPKGAYRFLPRRISGIYPWKTTENDILHVCSTISAMIQGETERNILNIVKMRSVDIDGCFPGPLRR
jgi:hypothetical protein